MPRRPCGRPRGPLGPALTPQNGPRPVCDSCLTPICSPAHSHLRNRIRIRTPRWARRPTRSATCAASARAGPRATCRWAPEPQARRAGRVTQPRVARGAPRRVGGRQRGARAAPRARTAPTPPASPPSSRPPDLFQPPLPAAQQPPAARAQVSRRRAGAAEPNAAAAATPEGRSRSSRRGGSRSSHPRSPAVGPLPLQQPQQYEPEPGGSQYAANLIAPFRPIQVAVH